MARRYSTAETLARRREAARLYYLGGLTQEQIAARFDVTQSQIFKDLRAVRGYWREVMGERLDEVRVEVLGMLDMVLDQAKEGWRRSLKATEKNLARTKRGAPTRGRDGKETPGPIIGTEAEKRKEERIGDPRFLDVIRGVLRDFREILGLDAPRRIVPATPDGKPLPTFSFIEFAAATEPWENGNAANGPSAKGD